MNLVCFSHGLMISLLSHQTISLALFFFHGLSCTVSLFSALSLFSSSSFHLYCVSLQFSASVTVSGFAYSLYRFWCVCVCHSAKILLTCGLVCLPFGNYSFILALAADGMYVSGKGDRWRSALKSNFMTLKATPSIFSSALYLDIGQQRIAT